MEYYQGIYSSNLSWESYVTPYEKIEWNVPMLGGDLGLIGDNVDPEKST
jgi:hypothetical protein